jgi:hypothetical protein
MARDDPQVNFRLPADLKARLEVDAVTNNRTLTAEIISRLQGPSPVESIKEHMAKTTFDLHYQFARFGLQTLRYAAQMVIAEASDELRGTLEFDFLEKAASSVRIPPELPKSQQKIDKAVSAEALNRVIDDLRKAAETLDARGGSTAD